MVRQMASEDPDSLLQAEVTVAGADYDPCSLIVSGGDSSVFGSNSSLCPDGFNLDR